MYVWKRITQLSLTAYWKWSILKGASVYNKKSVVCLNKARATACYDMTFRWNLVENKIIKETKCQNLNKFKNMKIIYARFYRAVIGIGTTDCPYCTELQSICYTYTIISSIKYISITLK